MDRIIRPRSELVKHVLYITLRSRYQDYAINARQRERLPRDVDAVAGPALGALKIGISAGCGWVRPTVLVCKGKTKLSSVNALLRDGRREAGTRLLVDRDQSGQLCYDKWRRARSTIESLTV